MGGEEQQQEQPQRGRRRPRQVPGGLLGALLNEYLRAVSHEVFYNGERVIIRTLSGRPV